MNVELWTSRDKGIHERISTENYSNGYITC